MTTISAEHRAVARAEAAEILRRVLAGEDAPKRVAKPRPSKAGQYVGPTGLKRGENLKGKPAWNKTDRDECLRLWNTGISPSSIAAEMGISRHTVSAMLTELEIPMEERMKFSPSTLQEKCRSGKHLLAETTRMTAKGRVCRTCQNDKAREKRAANRLK